jgi:hypothetical protein
MTAQPIHRWPKLRARKNGAHEVRGWYTVQWRFMVLRRITHLGMRQASGLVILFSVMPLMGTVFNIVPEGTYWYFYMTKLIELRQRPLVELHARFPELADQMWLHPHTPFNWAYLLVGFVMFHLSWQIAVPTARSISIVFPPLVKRRASVKIDQNRIRFIHLGFPRRFRRTPGVQVQFMCEQTQNPLRSNGVREPACQTVMRYGHRKIVICGSMHMRDAERLALGLSYARDLCDGSNHSFNEPTMPMPSMPMGW